MGKRYSELSHLTIEEQKYMCIYICNFFSISNIEKYGKKSEINNSSIPPKLIDFFNYCKGQGLDLMPKRQRITELVNLLKYNNVLESLGGSDITETLMFTKELSNREKKGYLWLGKALGASYIGQEIKHDIAYIEGITTGGDMTVGTGILISTGIVLTCAHVVDDITVKKVKIKDKELSVKKYTSHDKVDVAIIELSDPVPLNSKDIAFRDSQLLEPIVIAGYPTVPRSLKSCFTLQNGEISGHISETYDGYPLDLFSAIARPGNSGGPVLGLDGCITGIVTRSLERQREKQDSMQVFPFFASVPAQVIKKCVLEIFHDKIELPWEDFS